jgi:photosystem II stability/assembly factor-like uncharacterized protein
MSRSRIHRAHRRACVACLLLSPLLLLTVAAGPALAGWDDQTSGYGDGTWLEAVSVLSAQEAWIGGNPGPILLHTTDGGASWYGVDPGMGDDLEDVAFYDALHGWVANRVGVVRHTTDGGVTWETRTPAAGSITHFVPIGPTACWGFYGMADPGRLLKTTDSGQSWSDSAAWTGAWGSPRDGAAIDASTSWMMTWDKVYRTTDGGTSWAPSNPGTATFLDAFDALSASSAWAAGGDGFIGRTTDGGQTWTPVSLPTKTNITVEDVDFVTASTGWAITNEGTIWATTDGGATWACDSHKVDWIPLQLGAVDPTHAWITGTQGRILHTGDGGGPFDTTPPTIDVDAPSTWVGAQTNVVLSADDGTGVGGWKIEWKWETDAAFSWSWAKPGMTVNAPVNVAADHSRDGLHTLTYRGYDYAGNWTTTMTSDVGIDTVRPVAKAPSSAGVRRYRSVALKFRIDDAPPNGGHGDAQIVIKNKAGKVVKKSPWLLARTVNTALKWSFKCKLKKGVYRFYVNVRDEAGNYTVKKASNRLTVR